MKDIFFRKQSRILLGSCPQRGARQNPVADCQKAAMDGADFFGCQLMLTKEHELCCRIENACIALVQKFAAPGKLGGVPGMPATYQDPLAGQAKDTDATKVLACAKKCAMPLAFFVPDHVTRTEELRQELFSRLLALYQGCEAHLPLLLASSDPELLLLCKKQSDLATGLIIAPYHSCDVTYLCRRCNADMCILPKELATDCRLCGLRESNMYTMITGSFAPKEVLFMSISGADAFMADDAAPLVAAFSKREQI